MNLKGVLVGIYILWKLDFWKGEFPIFFLHHDGILFVTIRFLFSLLVMVFINKATLFTNCLRNLTQIHLLSINLCLINLGKSIITYLSYDIDKVGCRGDTVVQMHSSPLLLPLPLYSAGPGVWEPQSYSHPAPVVNWGCAGCARSSSAEDNSRATQVLFSSTCQPPPPGVSPGGPWAAQSEEPSCHCLCCPHLK